MMIIAHRAYCVNIFIHDTDLKLMFPVDFRMLSEVPEAKTPCQTRKELPVTIIYTDIVGLIQFKKRVKAGFAKFR